jgi:tripartite-type tricarboxylate transporter receptor subunit TctC
MIHRINRRAALAIGAGILAPLLAAPAVRAQGLRNVRFVVPYPPGGSTDTTGRIIAQRAAETLGQTWVIENRSGANGVLGAELVARSEPDGQTLLYSNEVLTVLRFVQRAMPVDVQGDLTPIARTVSIPYVMIGAPNLAPRDVAALLAAIKVTPRDFSFAGSSLGSVGQLATAALNQRLGTETTFVSYRGTGPAMNDLVSGNVSLFIAPVGASLPLIRDGRARAYATTSAARLASLPDVPTLVEAGFPGLVYEGWCGLWGPKGLPAEIANRVNAAVNDATADPANGPRMTALGLTVLRESPAEFARIIGAEITRNQALVAAAKIRPE